MKKIISRYLSQTTFDAVKKDFGFLIEKIKQSGFEYSLQIRDDYLNLYYKGNSLGKISYKKAREQYEVRVNHQFVEDFPFIVNRFDNIPKKYDLIFTLESRELHPFFSTRNLLSMAQKVKEVHFQEEIVFEQMLLTDNANRDDLIIIDRQVVDHGSDTKMDILALKKKEAGKYQFCILEVKLGNNKELEDKVFTQLQEYTKRIDDDFSQYKECYEKNFLQKQELGLMPEGLKVDIIECVLGFVVVGGYSGLAEQSIKELKAKHPDIKIIQIKNEIDFSKAK